MTLLSPRHCTLCGPDAGKRVRFAPNFEAQDLNAAVFSARRMPDRRHFQLVCCEGCGIIYSDPACDPAALASLYQASSVNYDRQEEQIFDSYAPVLDRGLRRVAKRGLFLEIGGGTGFMLRYGAQHGFAEQLEIEPSADAELKFRPAGPAARFVRGMFDQTLFEQGPLRRSSVSLACFFQMLDHVPSPVELLRTVHEALEPGGIAVCVTHDTSAFSARVLGERSPIYDIEHTYLFNPANLSRLFAHAGFTEIESFAVANRYSLRYWAHLAPLPLGLKRSILPALERTGLARLPLRLNAGNFAIIARKPPTL
ncbi:MAG: class I SAM-dependent methyltransferase [Oligoflexia bacterium]|nr:class I SAM-dependent methyltransferase [Oligoflexia bacterium]